MLTPSNVSIPAFILLSRGEEPAEVQNPEIFEARHCQIPCEPIPEELNIQNRRIPILPEPIRTSPRTRHRSEPWAQDSRFVGRGFTLY